MTAQAELREISTLSKMSAVWGVADVQASEFGDNRMTAPGRRPPVGTGAALQPFADLPIFLTGR
jgi:hypothetical protein